MPSVKYVFIVEPKVGGGSSYICCCCCCGRSGGRGAAYFAGGGGGAAGGAGAGGRGGWPPAEAVRQAVRRAAVDRAAAADGGARRAATRPCRSSVRLPRASMLLVWSSMPSRVRFLASAARQPLAGILREHQSIRATTTAKKGKEELACVDTLEFAGSPDTKPGYACSKELTA